MSTVTLTIGPKSYQVACADGEEAHIAALGAMIAQKYAQLGAARAPLEAQNLVFAALFLADDLAEAHKQAADTTARDAMQAEVARLEEQLAAAARRHEADAAARDALHRDIAQLEKALAAAAAAPAPEPAPAPPAAPATPQIDLFASAEPDPALAEQLEALADRAEASAAALEALAPTP